MRWDDVMHPDTQYHWAVMRYDACLRVLGHYMLYPDAVKLAFYAGRLDLELANMTGWSSR